MLALATRIVALLLLLVASSCFVSRDLVNEPLTKASIDRLQPGRTTARQVVELFGAPTDIVELGSRSAYLYEHDKRKTAGLWLLVVVLVGNDQRSDRLWLFFDDKDVLTHYGATLAADRASYLMPWESPDPVPPPDAGEGSRQ